MLELIFTHPFIVTLLIFITGFCIGAKIIHNQCTQDVSRHNADVVRPATAERYRLLMLAELELASSCCLRVSDKSNALIEEMASLRTLDKLDKKIQELRGESVGWTGWLQLDVDLSMSSCHDLIGEAQEHIKLAHQYQAAMNKWGNKTTYDFAFDSSNRYAQKAEEAILAAQKAEQSFNELRNAAI